ncbi:DUF1707 domain-containing protein [Kitasatospora sp. RB6PN24]|uniref:DUF1707 SHOCT-like domain-containing protein n=1 Tax=Kitasatospora humi TaxID=2893891 RepID=UPI001E3D0028|nr:DUF1707 domain-containing protein [Kitasatospora humi]MCC9310282.1 DUF1707 domain-containing protein [Kitasatospora humi]
MDTSPSGQPAPRPEEPVRPSGRPVPPAKSPQPPANRVAEAELRASDADRERIAGLLRDAYAEGRLTADEHAERLDAAYRARTLGELAPLTRDLPSHRPLTGEQPAASAVAAGQPVPRPPVRDEPVNLWTAFGGVTRKGRWRVGSRIRATAVFGGIDLDLSDAVFESPEVLIVANTFCGGIDIKVPENVTLVGEGFGILGGFAVREQTAADPHAPVVRVKGSAVLGGVDAKPRRGARIKEWVRRQLGS